MRAAADQVGFAGTAEGAGRDVLGKGRIRGTWSGFGNGGFGLGRHGLPRGLGDDGMLSQRRDFSTGEVLTKAKISD